MKETPSEIINFLGSWNYDLSNMIIENLNLKIQETDTFNKKFEELVLEYFHRLDQIHNDLSYSEQIEFYHMLPLTLKGAYTALLDENQLLACRITQ